MLSPLISFLLLSGCSQSIILSPEFTLIRRPLLLELSMPDGRRGTETRAGVSSVSGKEGKPQTRSEAGLLQTQHKDHICLGEEIDQIWALLSVTAPTWLGPCCLANDDTDEVKGRDSTLAPFGPESFPPQSFQFLPRAGILGESYKV